MSTGHTHTANPNYTINQGNMLGDRPCVRQSTLYRQHCGGNEMKSLLGQDQLKWDTKQVEGCYAGHQAYEFNGSTQDGAHTISTKDAQRQPANPLPSKGFPEVHHEQESYGHETTDDYYIANANGNAGGRENNGKALSFGNGEERMYTSGPINEPVSKHRTYGNGGGEAHLASGPSATGVARPTSRVNEPVDETTPISGSRKLRPGAGYANKQSYNIFTGELADNEQKREEK